METIPENFNIDTHVEQFFQKNRDEFLEILEEVATNPKSTLVLAKCISQIEHGEKIDWSIAPRELATDQFIKKATFSSSTSREIYYAAFFKDDFYDPLFSQRNQTYDQSLLTMYKEDPNIPSNEFTNQFTVLFTEYLKKKTHPHLRPKNDKPLINWPNVRDMLASFTQSYRLNYEFVEKLEPKILLGS